MGLSRFFRNCHGNSQISTAIPEEPKNISPAFASRRLLLIEISTFTDIQAEFMARIQKAVYCSLATVDLKGRPRTRVMHPVWDGPTGWVISWPESHKASHLQHNPYVSLAYIQDVHKPVYVEAVAEWIGDPGEKLRIWELHKATPPPLGFDPEPHYGSIQHRYYGLLRFTPWRIELAELQKESLVWRASAAA
jgi:general stress protein 26